jgi:hypothetical protein
MCICTIYTLYSTIEYDIIIGKITKIDGNNSKFNIGDNVFLFLDYYEFKICKEDPLMSLCIDEYYLFKIPNKLNTPLVLPFLKYGCISYVIRILSQNKNNKIIIYSNYNIYNIIHSMSKKYVNTEWKPYNDIKLYSNNYVTISNNKWIFKFNNIEYIFDFNNETLIHMFGKNNINILLQQLYFLNTGIYYYIFNNIENYSQINNNQLKKTRFFNIYTFI